MPVVTISEFSSLNFRDDWKLSFQQDEQYIQKFLRTDVLLVQYSTDPESGVKPFLKNNATGEIRELEAKLLDETTNTYNVLIGPVFTTEDTSFTTFFASDPAGDPVLSTDFCVCTDGLDDTVLLKYTNSLNDFDTIFDEYDLFTLRVPGVFLPQEHKFENETESFRDQRCILRLLSGYAYETKILTVGGSFGVPNWVARKLNLIFCLDNVTIDGSGIVRSDGSSPEITLIHNDYPLYVYKITLEASYADQEAQRGDFNDDYNNDYLINYHGGLEQT